MRSVRPARPVTPVTIAAERLSALASRLDGADAAEAREIAALVGGLDPYLASCTTPESPALAALAERTRSHEWGGALEQEMLSGHVEGTVLAFLVRATRARRVLEIGMFTGYSALAMAEALPSDGVLVACEIDADAAETARAGFAGSDAAGRIDVRLGPAADTLRSLAADGESFDMVFVDADKGGYSGYLELLLTTGLLAPGALVCVDNTLMQGEPWTAASPSPNGAAITAFNRDVALDTRVEQVVLPLRDGLTLIRQV